MTRGPTIHCDRCILRPLGIFGKLPVPLLKTVDTAKVPHVLGTGQTLFDEGAPALAVHCICSGSVKVTKLGPRGEEQIVRVLGPGQVVGYRAVLAGEPYSATAQALEDTTVCTIPAQVLLEMVRRSPEFALDVLGMVAKELRISEDALIDLRRKSVRQRLAGALLVLADARPHASAQRRPAVIRLARRDLARLIATSPESVSRALQRLAAEHSIACTRTEIRIINSPFLERAAGMNPFAVVDGRQASE